LVHPATDAKAIANLDSELPKKELMKNVTKESKGNGALK
jgi:hypothetical protein